MKYFKYQVLQSVLKDGAPILLEKTMNWSQDNEKIVLSEAYNGEYSVFEDGITEPDIPTQAERIRELEEALELLLSGVTE